MRPANALRKLQPDAGPVDRAHARPPAPAGSPPTFWTVEDVATALRVSRKTIERWASADATMPCLRIGQVLRFPAARLERWLDARTQGPGRARRANGKVRSAAQVAENTDRGGPEAGAFGHPVGQEVA